MKKILLSLFAVVAFAAAYAGIEVVTAASDLENDNTVVYVKSNANGNTAVTLAEPKDSIGVGGSKGISVVSVAGAELDWDAQLWLALPDAAPAGTVVAVKFDYKASAPVTIGTQSHGNPGDYLHWAAIGDVNFTTEWQTWNQTFTVAGEADGMKTIAFNLAKDRENDITFYIDNVELSFEKEVRGEDEPEPVYDWKNITAAEHTVKSSRGDAAGQFVGCLDGSNDGIVTLSTKGEVEWDAQFWINFTETLKSNTQVRVSFDYKADHAETISTQSHANPGDYLHWAAIGDVNFGTEWQTFTKEFKVEGAANGMKSIAFNMAKSENAFYMKNIKVEAWLEVEAEEEEDEPEMDYTVTPSFFNGVMEIALDEESEVSVDKAESLKVGFADNAIKVKHATYSINECIEYNFLGETKVVELIVNSGILSLNSFGYAEFEEPITFLYGHKYNVEVKAYDVDAAYLYDANMKIAEPIATIKCEFNGCYEQPAESIVTPALLFADEENTLNSHSEVAVGKADALLVDFEAMPNLMGASYAINAMKAVSDDEGTTWVVDESYDLAVGEMSVNGRGYAEFEDVLVFEQGYKYQLKVTVYLNNGTETPTEKVAYYVFNGSSVPEVEVEVEPALVLGEEEVTLNGHSEVSVDAAEGLKVNVTNCPQAIGISYAINTMKAVEDEEGTTWVADESYDLAVGEASMNSIAYAKFDDVIYFEQGQKYQVKVTVYGQPADEPAELVTYYYTINGSHVEAMEVEPALVNGEDEFVLNNHSEISAETAEGLRVNVINCPEAIGFSYAINVMKSVEDEEGTVWVADESFDVAVGEGSFNTIGYAAFDGIVNFEQGQKYQVKVTVYGQPADEPAEVGTYYYIVNGAYIPAVEVEPAFIFGDVESTLNSHSEASVDKAEALKVNVMNCPEAIGISYAINVMKAVEDEEGTTWVADESYDVAVGETSLNGFGYAEFEDVLVFEQGQKYQLKVTVYGQPTDEPAEVGTYYFVFNGSNATEVEVEPALVLGEEEVVLNGHSEVSVDGAEGLKVNVMNCPEAVGISYAINVMKAVEGEEGTTWVADESYDVAVGEASMNTIAYAKFDDVIYFEQGQKYLVKVTVYGQPADAPVEIGTYYYTINGSHAEAMEVEPALVCGEDLVALNSHSSVSVEAANGLNVNVINAPEAIGVTYLVNEMLMGEDENGIFWHVGAEVAAGEMNLNGMGFAEFEAPIKFYAGKKYQLTVTVLGGDPAAEPAEIGTFTYEFNGACTGLAAGDYLLKNVATGMFLNGANAWGTQASVTKHGQFFTVAALADGTYTLDSHISNGGDNHFLGTNGYVDSGAAPYVVEAVAEGVWAVKNGDKYLATNAENTIVEFAADEANEAAQWVFVTKNDVIASIANVTAENPVDVTALIADADFGRNNTFFDEWQGDKPGKGGDNANMNAEKWGGNSQEFDSYQTINLPNGKYVLKVQGYYRYNNTPDNTNDVAASTHADGTEVINSYFYANEVEMPLMSIADEASLELCGNMPFSQAEASAAFAKGAYQNELTVYVTDGTLKIGVKKIAHEGCDWTVWDNFELYAVEDVIEMSVVPALVNGEDEYALNSHSLVSVETASALKVNFENMPQVIGATYAINEMVMGEDEEGSFWHVGAEVAVGELSVNTIGYADFENAINFEAGKKYQLTVTAFANAQDPTEIGTYTFEFNGAYAVLLVDCDLTREMFHEWDSYEANGNIIGDGGCDYQMGVSTGMPYGNGSVIGSQYADLTGYAVLALTVTEGAPRLLLNRQDMGGSSSDFLEINNPNSEYVIGVKDGVWYINLAKITADKGYAHLNVIKGANWANVTITDAKLIVDGSEILTGINSVEVAAKDGKYLQNGKVVIVKNGKKYNTMGNMVK